MPVIPHQMCYVCQDKKRAKMAVGDVQRILAHMQELTRLIKARGYAVPQRNPNQFRQEQFFRSSNQRAMCGNCPDINQANQEIRSIEHNLNSSFKKLIQVIKDAKTSDEKTYMLLKKCLLDLTRGHYPQAARFVQQN